MKSKNTKPFSIALVLCLILAMMPVAAYADATTPSDATTDTAVKNVAQIGDTGYETLAEALTAAQAGDTVKLLDNVTSSNNVWISKNITLDLNGYTLTGTNQVAIAVGAGINGTIENGTLSGGKLYTAYVTGGQMTLSNVVIPETDGVVGVFTQNGTAIIEKSTIQGAGGVNKRVVVYGAASVTIGEGTEVNGLVFVNGYYDNSSSTYKTGVLNVYGKITNNGIQAISTNGTDYSKPVINIYDGAVIIGNGEGITAMYLPQVGTLNVYGGEITGVASGIAVKCGQINVLGGTITATGADDTPTEGFSNGINASGAAIQIESNTGYKLDSNTAGEINVNIKGGTVKSTNSYAVYEYIGQGTQTQLKSLSISGGTFISERGSILLSKEFIDTDALLVTGGDFSDDVAKYLTGNYITHETSDGLYNVHQLQLTKVDAKEATYTEEGNTAYWACTCGKLFADEEGKTEITPDSVVVPKLVQVVDKKAEVTTDAVEKAVCDSVNTDKVVLPLTEADENVESAQIPVSAIQTVIDENKSLEIVTADTKVTLDQKAMESIVKQAGNNENIEIKVVKAEKEILNDAQTSAISNEDVAIIISAEIICNGKNISDFEGGTVTVKIPFTLNDGETAQDYKLLYVADNGDTELISMTYEDGAFVAELEHFSNYVLAKVAKTEDQVTPSTTIDTSKTTTAATTTKTTTTTTVPKTGDTSNMTLWIVIMAISLMALVSGLVVYNKKRKN